MKNNFRIIICLLILSTSLYACSRQSHSNSDTTKPIITVVEPLANDTASLAVEPEVHIEFTATDETKLRELNVVLIKNNTDTLFNDSPTVDNLTVYAYHEHVVPSGIVSATPMTAIIRASDQSNNTETKIINFYVEP